jgi:alpha-ribazole phosphatase
MEIYLIRHTRPLIEKGLIYGRREVPLADTFQEEQQEILRQLPADLDAVYSSPSLRCTTLAQSITDFYQTDNALYEMNFGDWEGKTWETINREDSETWMNDFVNLSPPNGESLLAMQERVMPFWSQVTSLSYKQVAVITHGGVIRIILAAHRKLALKDAFTIQVGYAEVFRLTVSSG